MSEPSPEASTEFAAAAHAQSALVAASKHEVDDQAFVDALSWDVEEMDS